MEAVRGRDRAPRGRRRGVRDRRRPANEGGVSILDAEPELEHHARGRVRLLERGLESGGVKYSN